MKPMGLSHLLITHMMPDAAGPQILSHYLIWPTFRNVWISSGLAGEEPNISEGLLKTKRQVNGELILDCHDLAHSPDREYTKG